MDDALSVVVRLWPYAIVLAPGVWALYLRWSDVRKGRVTDRRDLLALAQEAAGEVIAVLREETDRLRGRVEELEAEIAELQKRHIDMIADKDAKILMLEGELRQAKAEVEAYRRLLIANNINPPPMNHTLVVERGSVQPAAEARL